MAYERFREVNPAGILYTHDNEPIMAWGCNDTHTFVIWWNSGAECVTYRR